jgi:hypothetical protein
VIRKKTDLWLFSKQSDQHFAELEEKQLLQKRNAPLHENAAFCQGRSKRKPQALPLNPETKRTHPFKSVHRKGGKKKTPCRMTYLLDQDLQVIALQRPNRQSMQ